MDYSSCSDDELLRMFKSGDIEGFNALYHRHWATLFHLSRKILEDEHLAKDTLQEMFVSFFENAKKKTTMRRANIGSFAAMERSAG